MIRAQKFYISPDDISKFLDKNEIGYLESNVYMSALNACARGAIDIGADPKSCEIVLAVNGRTSPSLMKFAVQCGGCEIAAAFLYKLGAAITGNCWQWIKDLV